MQEKKKTTEKLPTVPMRGTVAFPHMMMHFDVARNMSVRAVEEALLQSQKNRKRRTDACRRSPPSAG